MMTIEKWLLLPLFLHIALISFVGVRSVRARIASVRGGTTQLASISVSSGAWPDEVRKLGNNFDNQFQVPMLWYGVCALLLVTQKADWIGVVLSWIFLIARVWHSAIHIGTNYVPLRMRVFLGSFVAVFLMWAWFALRLYVIG
jgi:hypothetical protein